VLGGRRAWLLALSIGVAAWLARRVHRETRAWQRSPLLGAFWVGATLLLGLIGWVLFRFCEPRPAHARPVEAPRRARSSLRAELAPATSGPS
jgi:hypothetical protein